MTLAHPLMIVVALAVAVASVLAYRALDRRRSAALGSLATVRRDWRRHVPPMLFLAGLVVLLIGAGRPHATVQVPRVAGTVVLAFDVSNSMTATDVAPSRLAAAQEAAIAFVRRAPSTMDIGVVSFDRAALTARAPTNDHEQVVTTIERLRPAGGTSLGQAILASVATIVDRPIALPEPGEPPPTDLGYWGSATIVVLSDGEDTGGPDAIAAAELAAAAGIRIQAVGIGTIDGTTIEVDGFQVATALNEGLLTGVAQATAGSYTRAADVESITGIYQELELRITSRPELLELTAVAVLLAVALLTAGGLLMTLWYGRLV